jgi:hypothetical protein
MANEVFDPAENNERLEQMRVSSSDREILWGTPVDGNPRPGPHNPQPHSVALLNNPNFPKVTDPHVPTHFSDEIKRDFLFLFHASNSSDGLRGVLELAFQALSSSRGVRGSRANAIRNALEANTRCIARMLQGTSDVSYDIPLNKQTLLRSLKNVLTALQDDVQKEIKEKDITADAKKNLEATAKLLDAPLADINAQLKEKPKDVVGWWNWKTKVLVAGLMVGGGGAVDRFALPHGSVSSPLAAPPAPPSNTAFKFPANSPRQSFFDDYVIQRQGNDIVVSLRDVTTEFALYSRLEDEDTWTKVGTPPNALTFNLSINDADRGKVMQYSLALKQPDDTWTERSIRAIFLPPK